MLMAAAQLLAHSPHPDEVEIREGLAGNLCRCTGFIRIFESVAAAAGTSASAPAKEPVKEPEMEQTHHAR